MECMFRAHIQDPFHSIEPTSSVLLPHTVTNNKQQQQQQQQHQHQRINHSFR